MTKTGGGGSCVAFENGGEGVETSENLILEGKPEENRGRGVNLFKNLRKITKLFAI